VEVTRLITNPEKEKGTWVNLDPTCSVKVAYTNSKTYKRALRKELKPFGTVLAKTRDFDSIPEADQDGLVVRMLLQHTLFDWKGVQYRGKEVPFEDTATVKEILLIAPDFRELIENAAGDLSNFRDEEIEADTKNSVPASVGS
jgi:hypothetical protein